MPNHPNKAMDSGVSEHRVRLSAIYWQCLTANSLLIIQVPCLVCEKKHKQSRHNGERNMFFKYYMIFQEHGCSLNLTQRHEQDGQNTEPPLSPWASSVLQGLPCPFPSLFNWL